MIPWITFALLLALSVSSSSWADPAIPPYPAAVDRLDAELRGSIVYQHYCATCHGVSADGEGRAAKLYDPKPANLQTSRANDVYKELIIRRGGAQMGRSEFMPPWGQELTAAQTHDVIAYLRSILK